MDVEVAFRTNCNTDIRTYNTLLSETRGYTVDLHIWTSLSPYCGILVPHPYAMLLFTGSLYLSQGSIVARTFSFM